MSNVRIKRKMRINPIESVEWDNGGEPGEARISSDRQLVVFEDSDGEMVFLPIQDAKEVLKACLEMVEEAENE